MPELYAIRQISTGLFLPSGGKGTRGHTHQEPSELRPPRLFILEKSARRALAAYVQGKWTDTYTSGIDGEDYSGPEPNWKTKRDPKDFEVVKVEWRVVNNA